MSERQGWEAGAVAVVVMIRGQEMVVAHAGDSRAVMCRDGEAVELTKDHTARDEEEAQRVEEEGGRVNLGRCEAVETL